MPEPSELELQNGFELVEFVRNSWYHTNHNIPEEPNRPNNCEYC